MISRRKSFLSIFMVLTLLAPSSYVVKASKVDSQGEIFSQEFNSFQTNEGITKDDSSMVFNRYRRVFKGYSGKGEIILKNNGATSAKIYINGNLIDLKDSLNGSNSEVRLDIGLYTVDGENTLKILDVKPQGASMDIQVLYPELTYASSPEEVGFSSKKLEELDDFINKEVSEGFPGAALIVVKNGEIVKSSSYGYSKKWDKNNLLEEKEEMNVDKLFDIASLTKVLSTNFALQKLVSEGKLHVDDLVVKYLPTFVDKDDAKVKGKAASDTETVTASDIKVIDNKGREFNAEGISGTIKVTKVDTENPGDDNNGGNNGGNNNGGNNNNGNNGGNNSGNKPNNNKPGKLPNTGAAVGATGLGIIGAIATALGFGMRKKRK